MYHNTILYETELWTLDEMRVIVPKPALGFLENKHCWYYYFLLDSIEGKLLKVLTHGTLDISSRGKFFNQFLIFKHKEEKEDFDAFLQVNFNRYSDDLIIEQYKFALDAEMEAKPPKNKVLSAFHVAKSAMIYDDWLIEKYTHES